MRAYRSLLHLLPASFRDEYGGEMTALFADRLAAASPAGRAALWTGEIASLVATAARTHAELLGQDLRFALRAFRRAKAFALTAVGVTAIGIGATTVAFSLADHALLRPLPFPHPERLVRLWQDQSFRGYPRMELSPPNFQDWRARSTSFSGMAAFWDDASNLVGGGEPERVEGSAPPPSSGASSKWRRSSDGPSPPRTRRPARRESWCSRTRSGVTASPPTARSWAARWCSTASRSR